MAVATIKLHQTGKSLSAELKYKEECVVFFRPLPDWDGEFGFDWLREESTEVLIDNEEGKEPPYSEIIEAAFKKQSGFEETSDGEQDKKKAYELLKKEFVQLNIPSNYEYYVPWLAFPPKKDPIKEKLPNGKIIEKDPIQSNAILKVIYKGEVESMDIYLDYDNKFLNISKKEEKEPICWLNKGEKIEEIKITPKEEIAEIKEIKVYSRNEDGDTMVGKLLILTNNNIRKISKVKLVTVREKFINKKDKGDFRKEEIDNLEKILAQACVRVAYKQEVLLFPDIFQEDSKYATPSGKIIANEALLKTLRAYYFKAKEKQDDGSILIFLINKYAIDSSAEEDALGFTIFRTITEKFGNQPYKKAPSYQNSNTAAIFEGRNKYTLTHEFLHCLGLGHTHRDFKGNAALHRSQKFIFEKNAKITNVMSYSSIKKGIMWSWQWRLLSRYIGEAITKELNKNKI